MKPLAQLDPLTLQALVYVCPDRDLSKLLLWIPPNVSTAWLSFLLTHLQYRVITVNEVYICNTFWYVKNLFQCNNIIYNMGVNSCKLLINNYH